MHLARRMQDVQSPVIPVVGALIRAHPGAISLGQGVVHYGPPPEALQRAARFADDPRQHKYQPVDGIPELRAAIERKLSLDNAIRLDDSQCVVVTAGGNMAFFNAVLAIADPGDEIILPAPYYFNHEMALAMLNCKAQVVSTDADCQLDVEALEQAVSSRTRAIVTISPNNPTGAVYSRESLLAVSELCRRRGLFHISDEAYEYFTFDEARHFSPGSLPDSAEHTISLFSLSKSYGMASWRIGYMVMPRRLLSAVHKAQDTILICPSVVSQHAACGALAAGQAYWQPRVANIGQVRHLVSEELRAISSFCRAPAAEGAFYFLLELDTPLDSMTVVERLVREFGVGVLPGTTFGVHKGCSIRLAYGALEKDAVAEGVGRLIRGLRAIVGRIG